MLRLTYNTIVSHLFINVKGFTNEYWKLVINPIDKRGKIVYNGSMENKSTLTRSNVRIVGIPADLHARIKVLAERDDLAIYELVGYAIDAYEWRLLMPVTPAARTEAHIHDAPA